MFSRAKKVAAIVVIGVLTLTGMAAASTSDTTSAEHASRHRAAERLIRQFYAPFQTGKVDIYDSILTKDWDFQPPNPGQPSHGGPAVIKGNVGFLRAVFPDLKPELVAVTVSDNGTTVTVRTVFSGTQRQPFLGVPATGRHIAFRTTDVFHIRHGKIDTTWHLEDLFGAYQQLTATDAASVTGAR